ncbi:MAG: hypothetical protein ACRDZX_08785 [Acidimicrobiales bacterium]
MGPSGAVAFGVEVNPVSGIAGSGRFADDLAALFEVLGETSRDVGVGVLILVDELQEAPETALSPSTPLCTTWAKPTRRHH